ncbi:unnamed protein product [Rhodiola kirilowii]
MAHLFKDLSLGGSRRDSTAVSSAVSLPKSTSMPMEPLPTPFGELSPSAKLTSTDLRLIAYDIFVAVSGPQRGSLCRLLHHRLVVLGLTRLRLRQRRDCLNRRRRCRRSDR